MSLKFDEELLLVGVILVKVQVAKVEQIAIRSTRKDCTLRIDEVKVFEDLLFLQSFDVALELRSVVPFQHDDSAVKIAYRFSVIANSLSDVIVFESV